MPEHQGEKNDYLLPIIIVAGVIGLWVISPILITRYLQQWQERGTFGDMFGAVNALFSGLALAGVAYTIYLQLKEIRLQREDLDATLKELQRSAEAQVKAEQALREQLEAQNLATQLTALSSMLTHFDGKSTDGEGIDKHYAQENAEVVLQDMKKIFDEIKNRSLALQPYIKPDQESK